MKRIIRCFFIIAFLLCFCSCSQKKVVTIVSYNAQTFFDAVNDGFEFEEFKDKKKWSEKE